MNIAKKQNQHLYAAFVGLISYVGAVAAYLLLAFWTIVSQRTQGNDITIASAWLFAGSLAMIVGINLGWFLLKRSVNKALTISLVSSLTACMPIVWLLVYGVWPQVIFIVIEPVVFIASFVFYDWYLNILPRMWWPKAVPIIMGFVLYIVGIFIYWFLGAFNGGMRMLL